MANSFLMEWAPAPVLQFASAAHDFLRARGPAAVRQLQDEFTALFRREGVLAELVNAYLRRVANGQADGGDPVVNVDILVVLYAQAMSLRVIKDRSDVPSYSARPWAGALNNYPANTLIFVASAAPVTVDWYGLAPGADFDVFDATLKIRHEGREPYANGAVIHVDARSRFPVLPAGAVTYVALAGAPVNSQIVSFDKTSLQPLGASMASEDHSVLCVMLGLLDPRQPDYPLAAVQELAGHPDHHVRWAAVTALGRHSRAAALPLVRQMALHDSHRFIRDAARQTLRTCAN